MNLRLLTNNKERKWDDFVKMHPKGSIYFKIAWKDTVVNEFGHESIFIYIEDNEEIVAVLPLFLIHSIFGKKLVSIPYCPYGGVLSKNDEAEHMLIQEALRLRIKYKADYIELKSLDNQYDSFSTVSNYLTFHLSLEDDFELIESRFSKNTKRNINKAKKLDYELSIDSNINIFYDLYDIHMRKIGTPSLSKRFFHGMALNFGKSLQVATIWYKGVPAASIVLLFSDDSIIYDRGATNYELRHLNLNYALFWELIRKYSNTSHKYFDFGRSVVESGTYQFKNGWRPEIKKMNYQYLVSKGKLPDYSQESFKRKLFTKLFKKLPNFPFLNYQLRKRFL